MALTSTARTRVTDPDQPPTDPGTPAWAEEAPPSTPLTRLRDRGGRVLAVVLAVFLVVPAGAWLVDTVAFNREGAEVAEAVPALADAVALVTRLGCDGSTGTGSGFAIEYRGGPALVTNRHVVQGAAEVGLRTLAGGAGPQVVEVLVSPRQDVAVLRLDEGLGSALAVGDGPTDGDEVRLVGFPGARPITSAGTVTDATADRVLLDIAVGAGASGAPVVDEAGTVVAQVVARQADGSGVAIAAPAVLQGIRTVVTQPPC